VTGFSTIQSNQIKDLKIPPGDVKAVLILDDSPSHPHMEQLISKDGKIRFLTLLPPYTASLIQPLGQGIILATKRLYRRKYLDEVVMILEDSDEVEDTKERRALQNYRILKNTLHH